MRITFIHRATLRISLFILFFSVSSHTSYSQTKMQKTHKPDAIYIPTPPKVVDKMIEMADIQKDDLVYDLGCGDARIIIEAAKKFGCKCVGFDIDPEWVKKARANVKKHNLEDLIRIELKDIFTLDLSQPDVIMMYLTPSVNLRLLPQLRQAKPGTRIVSHDYKIEGVQHERAVKVIVELNEKHDPVYKNYGTHNVYLWVAPLPKKK